MASKASRLPGKVESGINKVGRGAKSAVDGAVAITGKAVGFLEGPVAAAAMIIVAFLGLWALYKMFRSWECRPGKGTTVYNAGRTIARHSAHIKKAKADSNSLAAAVAAESADNKHNDVRCAVALSGLRAVSETLPGDGADLAAVNGQNASDDTIISNSLNDVRKWCQHKNLKDGKLNACDAVKAWKAECEMKAATDTGIAKGAAYIAKAATKDNKKLGELSLERTITGDALGITQADAERISGVAAALDTANPPGFTFEACNAPLADADIRKLNGC